MTVSASAMLRALLVCAIVAAAVVIEAEAAASPLHESNSTNGTASLRRELKKKKKKVKPALQLKPGGCDTGNPIDACWRCTDWESEPQRLADCAIGFGASAIGGKNGPVYVVTDPSDDEVIDPKEGTLRYGVLLPGPTWIRFAGNYKISLSEELIVTDYKTIDGRGHDVEISDGGSITIQGVSNVIITHLKITNIKSTGPARIRSSVSHVGDRGSTDGDGISVMGSSNIWLNNNYLSQTSDGLIDVNHGSDAITISNNYFTDHNKVMLLGARDSDYEDKSMRVTVAFNYFGANLVQRMPRCRLGTFHIVNNYYEGWGESAIGGSANPTINSEGNYFNAGSSPKRVDKNLDDSGNWRSLGDLFVAGAFFTPYGASTSSSLYKKANSISPIPASLVRQATGGAGPT